MHAEKRYSFYGFHGTAESCAIAIGDTRNFEFGEPRTDHWLGQGAYFYKDDEEQAIIWAKNKVKNHVKFRGETPFVIEVILESNESNFLNLDTRKGLDLLKNFLNFLKEEGMIIETSSFENIHAKIRCFILSLLPPDVWMIQRTFHDIPSRFDHDELFVAMDLGLVGTQVCVRNTEVIKGNSIKIKKIFTPIKRNPSGKPRYFG